MKIYLYAQSGHNFGLEKIRICSIITKLLNKYEPLLCTADYRAATFAKEQLDVIKAGGVDVLTNMPNIMEKGDILIYDSEETTETMIEHMKHYCTLLFHVGSDISSVAVDELYKNNNVTPTIEKLFYYGDDDYQDSLLHNIIEEDTKHDIDFLMGHYMFFGNESKLSSYFSNVIDEEEYNDTILRSKFVLTGSEQTALEVLASGGFPVLLKREDKNYRNLETLQNAAIPMIENYTSINEAIEKFNTITENYPEIKRDIFSKFDEDIQKMFDAIAKYNQIIEMTKNLSTY